MTIKIAEFDKYQPHGGLSHVLSGRLGDWEVPKHFNYGTEQNLDA